MGRIIIKKSQLNEYVENKKAKKTYALILHDINRASKYLNENVSINDVKQTIIDYYKNNDQLTPKVIEMLINNKIINDEEKII